MCCITKSPPHSHDYRRRICLAGLLAALAGSMTAHVTAATWTVSTASQLDNAWRSAAAGDEIVVLPGAYNLLSSVVLRVNNLTLRGSTGNRDDVSLVGSGMNTQGVNEGIIVEADFITVKDLTVRDFYHNGIHVRAENDADSTVIRNVKTWNIGERHIKGSRNPSDPNGVSDNVLIENCYMLQTIARTGHPETSPDYIGGIDMMSLRNPIISDNVAEGIVGGTQGGNAAIFLWAGIENAIVERNRIFNCAKGIAYGNPYLPDDPNRLTGEWHAAGGVIRNNFIRRGTWTGGNNIGIELANTRDVTVAHNTVYSDDATYFRTVSITDSDPTKGNTPGVSLANNVVRGALYTSTYNGGWTSTGNIFDTTGTTVVSGWFVNTSIADLHLTASATGAIDQVAVHPSVTNDFDSQTRPIGASADRGADEFGTSSSSTGISREVWTGVSGTSVASIPLGNVPNTSDTLSLFEGPTNWADNYGTRIRGYLIPPTTGNYTFWIASDDDSELWISTGLDSAPKTKIASVTGWTNSREWNKFASQKSAARSLTAGVRYYIEALHTEGTGGDNIAVGWAKPGESTTAPSEVIPGSRLAPFSGLKGQYYDNSDFTTLRVTRIDSTVNFDWGTGAPDASMAADTFSVRWTGSVRPLYSQTYTFYTTTDDGVRLWVNGQLLIDKWLNQAPTEWSGTISLTANQDYDIRMDYYDNTGGAVAKLSWSSASQPKEIIPAHRLFPPTGLPSPWLNADIGSVAYLGSASYDNSKFTLKASGADIWGTADAFHYVYQTASGNCEIIARVASVQNTDPWAKAGVMIRESLNANSKHVMMGVTPGNGTTFLYRTSTGGTSASQNPVDGIVAPYWVRLVRSGNTITGYKSSNGSSWTQVASVSVSMTSSVYFGLALTAHNNAARNTSTFESITALP